MRLKFTGIGLADALVSIWMVSVGVSFVLMPVLAGSAGEERVASVWIFWRHLYAAVLAICSAGVAVRVCRRLSSRRNI